MAVGGFLGEGGDGDSHTSFRSTVQKKRFGFGPKKWPFEKSDLCCFRMHLD